MYKEIKEKCEEVISLIIMILIYIGLMYGGYLFLNYYFTGEYKSLVKDNSLGSIIVGKDQTIEYLGNYGIWLTVLCILLMTVISIIMFVLIVNGIKSIKQNNN